MGKYIIEKDPSANCINLKLSGIFSPEDGMNFVTDFLKISSETKTDDTYLVLDCAFLHVYPYNVTAEFKDIFYIYKQSGYKLIRFKFLKPQKEFARNVMELSSKVGLHSEIIFMDLNGHII